MPDLTQDQLPPIPDPANIDQVRAEEPMPMTLDNVADIVADDIQQPLQPTMIGEQPVSVEDSLNRKAVHTVTAMQHVILCGKSSDSQKWIDANQEYKDFLDPDLTKDRGGDYLIGAELAEGCYGGDVFGMLYNILDSEQDEARKAQLATQIKACNTADAKRLLGQIFREGVLESWQQRSEYMRACVLAKKAQDDQKKASLLNKVVDSGTNQITPEELEAMQKAGLLNPAMAANAAILAYLDTRDSRDAEANVGTDVATAGRIGDIISNSENPMLARQLFIGALQRVEVQAGQAEGRESVVGHAAREVARDALYFTQGYTTDKYLAEAARDGIKVNDSYFDDRADIISIIRQTRQGVQQELSQDAGGLYNIGIAAGDMLPYFIPNFMPNALARHNLETRQDNISVLMDDGVLTDEERSDASINASTSTLANAGAMYGTVKAFKYAGTKFLPVPIARISQNRIGAFAVNTAEQTANFGIALPVAEGTLNWVFDIATNTDERIHKGKRELAELISNMGDFKYWQKTVGLAVIGAIVHNNGSVQAAKNRLHDRAVAKYAGLTDEQINSTETLPQEKRDAKRYEYLRDNMENDKENTILRSIAALKESAEKFQAAQKRRDNATVAACRLMGFDVEASEKPGMVRLYHDCKTDKDGNLQRGKFIELPEADANAYLNGVIGEMVARNAKTLRTLEANKRVLDAAKNLKGKVTLETIRTPEIVSKVQDRAKKAAERKQKRAEELMQDDPKLSKAEAEKRAGREIHKDINAEETLDALIDFGRQMDSRLEIEKARGNETQDIQSRAYVLTKGSYDQNTIERIFKIATDASTAEVVEEYGEQLRKDWMNAEGISVHQAYRMLTELQSHFGEKAAFLTLKGRDAALHQKATADNVRADDFTAEEGRELAQEVTEALSRLLQSDLLQQVKAGNTALPEWARQLFDGTDLIESELSNELAIGAALAQARAEGWMPELMKKLMDTTPQAVADAIRAKAEPSPQDFADSYLKAYQRQAVLDARYGAGRATDPELVNRQFKQNADGQQKLDEESARREQEAAQANDKIIKEAEAEPENKDKSHEEVVKQVADNFVAARQEQVATDPTATKDAGFANGNCIEIQDATGLLCKSGVVNVANLKVLPNFKLNADSETGVVQSRELTGPYRADHDPIRIFRDTNGNMWVISGRHRLAKCKSAGVDKISAYVYDEGGAINLDWARRFDIESNIRDNQASVIECALYTRGELFEGGKPLTETEAVQAGLTRKGTQGNTGYLIGRDASGSLIDALRNGKIDDREAFRIAQLAPRNLRVQNVGLILREKGESWKTVEDSMHDTLDVQTKEGDNGQMDMFGVLDSAEDVMRIGFENKYKNRRIKAINDELSYLNQVAGGGSVKRNAKYDVNVKSPEKLKERINALKTLRHQWENMRFYPELVQEARRAYAGEELFTEQTDADIARREQELQPEPEPQDAGQGTLDLSTTAGRRKTNPVDNLGQLVTPTRFAKQLSTRLNPVGFDPVDQRFVMMKKDIARLLQQLAFHGNTDSSAEKGFKLFTEANGIVESVNRLLPNSYKMSLQPYKVFMDVYATLYDSSSARKAADRVPMQGWDRKMYNSFLTQLEKAVENPHLLRSAEYWKDFPEVEALIKELNTLDPTKDIRDLAKTKAASNFFGALGSVRAQRLMDNYLRRAELQLDKYRKDVCLGRILRAVDSLTPAKNGSKPVKGRIAPDQYRTIQDRVAMLRLARGERDTVIHSFGTDKEGEYNYNALPDDTRFDVEVYGADGTPRKINVSKAEFDTYSCFDEMSAEHVEATARALGTYIKEGREAWDVVKEQRKQRLEQICGPLMDAKYQEINDPVRRKASAANKIMPKKGAKLRFFGDFTFNDAQMLNAMAKEGSALESTFKEWELRVAKAHVLLETGERDTQTELERCVSETLGTTDRAAWRKFYDDINEIHDSGINLTPQPPDFVSRETDTLRAQLLRQLAHLANADRPNYDPNGFAVQFQYLMKHADSMPPELVREINAKYGNIGNAAKFKQNKGGQTAEDLQIEAWHSERSDKFRDFNAAVQERAAKAEAKWKEDHNVAPPLKNISLTKNIAAYRVLIWEQSEYQDSMRQQGYNEQVIQQLRDFAGEKMMDYAYKLRESLNSRTDDIAKIYEQIYGMPFPKVENYFRAFFQTYKEDAGNPLERDAGNAANSGTLSVFKHRVRHNAPLDALMSVTHAYANGRKQHDTLIAYAKDGYLPDDMNALLNFKRHGHTMRDFLDIEYGEGSASSLQLHIDNMTKLSAEIDQTTRNLTRAVSLLSNSSAINILDFRVGSIVKQATALFNSIGADEASVGELYASSARVLRGAGKISLAELAQDPALSSRFKGWTYSAERAAALANAGTITSRGAHSAAAQAGMSLMEWLDYKANIVSSAVLYDAVYRKCEKQYGNAWTKQDLHAAAMDAVTRSLANKAQPLDFRSRSISSGKRDAMRAALFFLGGESINTFARVYSILSRGGKGSLRKAAALYLQQGIALQALTFIYNFLTDNEEQWRKRSIAGYLTGALFGPLSGIPFFGSAANEGIEFLKKRTGWKWLPYMNAAEIMPYFDLERIYRDWERADSFMDYTIVANDTIRIMALATAVSAHSPTSRGAATAKGLAIATAGASNAIDFLLRATRANVEGEGYIKRISNGLPLTPKKKRYTSRSKTRHHPNAKP